MPRVAKDGLSEMRWQHLGGKSGGNIWGVSPVVVHALSSLRCLTMERRRAPRAGAVSSIVAASSGQRTCGGGIGSGVGSKGGRVGSGVGIVDWGWEWAAKVRGGGRQR